MKRPRLPLLLAAGLCAAGCAASPELEELDRAQRALDARTIALEEHFTLWSPFDFYATHSWIEVVSEELVAVEGLFGEPADERVYVKLTPVDGLDAKGAPGCVRAREASAREEHPLNGVAGQTLGNSVNLFVASPEAGVPEDPRGHRSTLRHELAHAFSSRAGLDGPDWFREGLAQYVESLRLDGGVLRDDGAPVLTLVRARRLPLEMRALERLLAWEEDGRRILAGEEEVDFVSRTLCGLFVRFLLETREGEGLAERLRSVSRLSVDDLLAEEEAWQSWLAGPRKQVRA